MSQWTHVTGVIRLDGFMLTEDEVEQGVISKLGIVWDGYSYKSKHLQYTPCGSEGGIHYKYHKNHAAIKHYDDPNNRSEVTNLARGEIIISGDLRDFPGWDGVTVDDIINWVRQTAKLSDNVRIRQGLVQISVEGNSDILLIWCPDGWYKTDPEYYELRRRLRRTDGD
jgi:hypothetical protein